MNATRVIGTALSVALLTVPLACAPETITITGEKGAATTPVPTWPEFRDSTQRLVSADGGDLYVVEGDIVIDEKGLLARYNSLYVDPAEKSIVATIGGVDQVWTATEKVDITYCVSNGFGSDKGKALADVQEGMAQWMSTANVVFKYVPSQDAACSETNTGVRLNVILNPSGGGLTCIPHACRALRMTYANPAGWDKYSWLGAWTHELGHSLGLWHEHVRVECGVADTQTFRTLTAYDNSSSLHYSSVCGSQSVGQITSLDAQGLASLYGAPSSPVISVLPAAWIQQSQYVIN